MDGFGTGALCRNWRTEFFDVVPLDDGETILNAFPDRNFRLSLGAEEAKK